MCGRRESDEAAADDGGADVVVACADCAERRRRVRVDEPDAVEIRRHRVRHLNDGRAFERDVVDVWLTALKVADDNR